MKKFKNIDIKAEEAAAHGYEFVDRTIPANREILGDKIIRESQGYEFRVSPDDKWVIQGRKVGTIPWCNWRTWAH